MFQSGRHDSGRLLAVRSVANGGTLSRYAFSVSKRVGKAVTRNKLRRRLRESIRVLPLKEGHDIIVTARPAAAASDFQTLRGELVRLLRRARLLAGDGERPPASA